MKTVQKMTRTGLPMALLLLAASTASAAGDAPLPHTMTLITYNGRPATNIDAVRELGISIQSLNLDGLDNIATFLLRDIPLDPESEEEVVALVQSRVKDLDPNDLASVFRAQLYARRWDLKRVPALVINKGEAVLYGITDFEHALEIWQAREEQ